MQCKRGRGKKKTKKNIDEEETTQAGKGEAQLKQVDMEDTRREVEPKQVEMEDGRREVEPKHVEMEDRKREVQARQDRSEAGEDCRQKREETAKGREGEDGGVRVEWRDTNN